MLIVGGCYTTCLWVFEFYAVCGGGGVLACTLLAFGLFGFGDIGLIALWFRFRLWVVGD